MRRKIYLVGLLYVVSHLLMRRMIDFSHRDKFPIMSVHHTLNKILINYDIKLSNSKINYTMICLLIKKKTSIMFVCFYLLLNRT